MSNRKGMTLIELQIGAVLMVVVLVTAGVIFYFCLNAIRFLHDAYTVQMNAQNVIKIITAEVIKANRYGWEQASPSGWVSQGGSIPDPLLYGGAGPEANSIAFRKYLTLETGGVFQETNDDKIIVRQDIEPITGAAFTATPDVYYDDRITVIFRDAGTDQVRINRGTTGPVPIGSGLGDLIGTNISFLRFEKVDFNCVEVSLTATGDVPDPLGGGQYNIVMLKTKLVLHSAPAATCEPMNVRGDW